MSFKEKQIESIYYVSFEHSLIMVLIRKAEEMPYRIKHSTASESVFNNLSLHERESPTSNIEQQEVHTPQANATNVSTN